MAITNSAENTINTKLLYRASTSGDWTELPCIKNYPDLGGEPEQIEATTMCDAVTKNVLGVQAMDGFSFTMNYNGEDYETIEALKGQTLYFKLSFKDAYQVTWQGEASCWINAGEVNGVKEMTFYTSVLTEPAHDVYSAT